MILIGVGNELRGDDAAGLEVARRLGALECEAEPTALMAAWEGAEDVVLVDALSSGGEPGTVRRFDASAGELPEGFAGASTHGFGLGETIALARALATLPARVVVYGIEGADFRQGAGLSPAVAAAVDEVAALIEREEERCTNGRFCKT